MPLPLNDWTDSELADAVAEIRAFAGGTGRVLLRYGCQQRIAALELEGMNLAIHTPEGAARYHEVRGELAALNRMLRHDFGMDDAAAAKARERARGEAADA